MKTILTSPYRFTLIPVLVNNILENRAGPYAVLEFLQQAHGELILQRQRLKQLQRQILNQPMSRRDHVDAATWFDHQRKHYQNLARCLGQLNDYIQKEQADRLRNALTAYGKAHHHWRRALDVRKRTSWRLQESLKLAA